MLFGSMKDTWSPYLIIERSLLEEKSGIEHSTILNFDIVLISCSKSLFNKYGCMPDTLNEHFVIF